MFRAKQSQSIPQTLKNTLNRFKSDFEIIANPQPVLAAIPASTGSVRDRRRHRRSARYTGTSSRSTWF